MLSIVAIGGGTGLSVLLRGLRMQADAWAGESGSLDVSITGIVSVSDSGGSTGRLRSAFGIPAVGDLRRCLTSLCEDKRPLAGIFDHRFPTGVEVQGHALGNLILLALTQQYGCLSEATRRAAEMLEIQGTILPSTNAYVTICAEYPDGNVLCGESEITQARGSIQRICLAGENPLPAPGILEAIRSADVLIFGPGSLFTSIITNILVAGVSKAIAESPAPKIVVSNLMTQPGETHGFTASDHLAEIQKHLGGRLIDFCLLNSRSVSPSLKRGCARKESFQVVQDWRKIMALGAIPIWADMLAEAGGRVRHHPLKLGRTLLTLIEGLQAEPSLTQSSNDRVA